MKAEKYKKKHFSVTSWLDQPQVLPYLAQSDPTSREINFDVSRLLKLGLENTILIFPFFTLGPHVDCSSHLAKTISNTFNEHKKLVLLTVLQCSGEVSLNDSLLSVGTVIHGLSFRHMEKNLDICKRKENCEFLLSAGRNSVVPRMSLLPYFPREVWEGVGETTDAKLPRKPLPMTPWFTGLIEPGTLTTRLGALYLNFMSFPLFISVNNSLSKIASGSYLRFRFPKAGHRKTICKQESL